jgi:HSP20 family protein
MKSPNTHLTVITLCAMAILMAAVGVQSYFLVKLYRETQSKPEPELTEAKVAEVGPLPSGIVPAPAPSQPKIVPANPFDDDYFSGFGDDWHPFKEMERMREEMDQIFGKSLGRFQQLPGFDSGWLSKSFAPDVDIEENDDAYIVTMDAPGIEKANVNVSLENGVLTIKGTREEINEEKEGDKVLRSERRQGTFQRAFSLPGPVDEASMKTDLSNGVLKVTIKKAS